ncbi:Helicase associated domain protein [Carboxylicivirga linearis]|uniref:Helicase associated domain protein n=1 Tax=Carboxylicivirga linearis TaxID=1628157 RepID=A0ABS5JXK1_9BACT|nr:Helicase associated domain protein [Carboxylicivirga linearis]MBS2099515.1 Helicase associated domain protein [Carboxylicivirga linearis]
MIVEFIGQGIQQDENDTAGNYICSSFKEDLFTEITVFVAFVRRTGLNSLKPFIKKAISENRAVRFFVGIDEKVTSKEALELLLELGVETYIYSSPNYIYHPKVYLFEGVRNRIITGSTNLTQAGFFYNVESSILLDFTENDKSGLKVLNQLKEYFSPLLDFSDPNIEPVTQEKIDELVSKGLLSIEKFDSTEGDYKTNIFDRPKRKLKSIDETELGNIEITENRPTKTYSSILKITDEYLDKWDFMYEKMKSFYHENNHCTVPRDYKDRTLYGWYLKQKRLYDNDLIPDEHYEKLNEIEFYFGDNHDILWDRKWMESYNQLYEIYKETGEANLKRYTDNTHPLFKLSNWVALERGKYHKEPKKIKDWQIERLEAIGFKWVMQRVGNSEQLVDDWLDRVALLEEYKKEHGHCNVSQTDKNPKYKGLGKWLNDQRFAYKKDRLQPDRLELLESMGVVWDMDVYNFDIRINQLIAYKEEFGNFDVSSSYPKDPSFGNYVYRLKTKGVKEDWKIKKLHDIGFYDIGILEKREKKGHVTKYWWDMLSELKKLENPNIPREFAPNPKLGIWLDNQKKAYRHNKLKDEQIAELEKLKIELPEYSLKRKRWNDYIELIEMYIEEYGDSNITADFDPDLHKWINQQKINALGNKLKAEKRQKLVDLKIIKNEP